MAIGTPESVRVAYGNSLSAAIDAGVTCVPKSVDRIYNVVDAWVRAAGTASDGTSVDISDGTTTVVAFTRAGLEDTVLLRAGTATTGVATNLGVALAANTGIQIKTTGNALATTTAIEWCIFYTVTSVT